MEVNVCVRHVLNCGCRHLISVGVHRAYPKVYAGSILRNTQGLSVDARRFCPYVLSGHIRGRVCTCVCMGVVATSNSLLSIPRRCEALIWRGREEVYLIDVIRMSSFPPGTSPPGTARCMDAGRLEVAPSACLICSG